ncbi:MAG: glutathione S-transferase family protein [Myxococcota bacterium]
MRYVLYGLRLSYFTRKLEAALELMGVPFEYRSKTMGVREEIERRAGTHRIPVLHTPEDWMIADTTPLIDMLDGRFPHRRLFPAGPHGVLAHVVEELFDEWIPRTAVHFRWQHGEGENWAAPRMAEETAPDVDPQSRNAFAAAVADWGRRACRATGVAPEAQQRAAEEELDRLIAALDEQLGRTAYALGDRPTAVDAVLLGGLRGHFLLDPVPRARYGRFERVVAWAERRHPWDGTGEMPPFPETTPFAEVALEEMARSYRPFLLGNARALEAGDKAFVAEVHGEEVSYRTRPDPERSRRMIVDRIRHRLTDEEREAVHGWLEARNLADLFAAR